MKKNDKVFIQYTLDALEQYRDNLPKGQQNYSRTLFLNACLGLLIIPRVSYYDNLPVEDIKDWGLSAEHIQKGSRKRVKQVVRHLRNAIAHNNFDYDNGEYNGPSIPITEITFIDKFIDKNKNEKEVFKATFTFDEFFYFVNKVAKKILQD